MISEDDFEAVWAVQGDSEAWEKRIVPVTKSWRMDICSKNSFMPYPSHLPDDEAPFMMRQRQAPAQTAEVEPDGNCFFR